MSRIREHDHPILVKLLDVMEQVKNVLFGENKTKQNPSMTLSSPTSPSVVAELFFVKPIPSRIFLRCKNSTEVFELGKITGFFFFSPSVQMLVISSQLEFPSLNQPGKILNISKPQLFHV